MEQLAMGLFRNSDPHTSRLAAEIMERSGTRASQRQTILDYVRAHPDQTSKEIASGLGLCRYAVARRLPDLERDGLVCKAKQWDGGVWVKAVKQVSGERDAVMWRAFHD